MKETIVALIVAIMICTQAFAQINQTQFDQRLDQLEQELQVLKDLSQTTDTTLKQLKAADQITQRSVTGLSSSTQLMRIDLDSLSTALKDNSQFISVMGEQLLKQKMELSEEIIETQKSTTQRASELDEALSRTTLYWIIAVLALGILSMLAFTFLRRKVTNNQVFLSEQLTNTRRELEQEAIRLDEKLVGVMETQIKLIQEERENTSTGQNGEQDHSLALKVADEIVRIEKNIGRMDKDIKGLKQLTKAIERIRDNFAANGYEMVDMLNKPYEEGMKASVVFRPDPELETHLPLITRIIKPQVNYNGVMIQQAQIEVSQPEQ